MNSEVLGIFKKRKEEEKRKRNFSRSVLRKSQNGISRKGRRRCEICEAFLSLNLQSVKQGAIFSNVLSFFESRDCESKAPSLAVVLHLCQDDKASGLHESRLFKRTFSPVCFVNQRFSTFHAAPSGSANSICATRAHPFSQLWF